MEHVDVDGPEVKRGIGGCWLWTGAKGGSGYGLFHVERDQEFSQKTISAHRVPWIVLFGAIPAGLEPDHRCETRECVNPFHLDLVTHRLNVLRSGSSLARNARKTHCPWPAGPGVPH